MHRCGVWQVRALWWEDAGGRFGDCCGGADGKQTVDEKLWKRLQANSEFVGIARTDVSALCLERGENMCQQPCKTFDDGKEWYDTPMTIPKQLSPEKYCSAGQVCVMTKGDRRRNECKTVNACPTEEEVLNTPKDLRWQAWDDPDCQSGCDMADWRSASSSRRQCGGLDSGYDVPCCVVQQPLHTLRCPMRSNVLATPRERRWAAWHDPACASGCTLDDCDERGGDTSASGPYSVPCCVLELPQFTEKVRSLERMPSALTSIPYLPDDFPLFV